MNRSLRKKIPRIARHCPRWFLAGILAVAAAGCGPESVDDHDRVPRNFAAQCASVGHAFEHRAPESAESVAGDAPGVPTFKQPDDEPRVGDVDALSGASGDYYYSDSSFLDAGYLMGRVNGLVPAYEWVADETGAATLADACELEGRESIVALYPDDGRHYRLGRSANQQGSKLVSTVSRVTDANTGEISFVPNIATFGFGMISDDGRYYMTLEIGRSNTCVNAVESGDIRFLYYEYDRDATVKRARNRGARIIGQVDYARTALRQPDWRTELEGLGVDEAFSPADVDWNSVGACYLVVEVTGIYPLG